eukprot:GHUV01032376.1.p1 GENE.GHUV01032376.1~~GHUV01032376.1.p1  ORF type:complete len:160 (+),score=42.07 GHUV01032376.1:493-972(+)
MGNQATCIPVAAKQLCNLHKFGSTLIEVNSNMQHPLTNSTRRILFALRQYANCTEQEITRWEHNYRALSARHRAILSHLPAKAAAARRAVQQNQLFIKAMLLNFAGQMDDDEDGIPGGGSVPDDLALGALAYADHLEATGERCSPGDAEKVLAAGLLGF